MKEQILETSLEQFLKYGIRKMSVQNLVAPLGISTKTVYKYFRNKEDLLEEALLLYHGKRYEILDKLPATQNPASLFFDIWRWGVETEFAANKVFYQDLHYYYPALEKKVEGRISKTFRMKFLEIIDRGINSGDFRADINPEVVLESIFVLYVAALRVEHFAVYRLEADDLMHNTLALLIRGICTDKGLKALDKRKTGILHTPVTRTARKKAR